MIDITQERLIPLRDTPRRLPARSSGKRVHISAVYRWIQRGIRGVRLESIRIGGTMYTSAEALQRFADALTSPGSLAYAPTATTAARDRELQRTANRLSELLDS